MGFGNPARNDDGIGIHVIEKLMPVFQGRDDIQVLDMGTSAFETLFKLKGAEQIIVIDAVVNSGKEPGSLFQLPAKEVESELIDEPLVFLHSLKWSQALYYAKNILKDDYPDDNITAYLIAVDDIGFGVGISPVVLKTGERLASILEKEYA